MPAPPNRFAPVGTICAREKEKRSAVDRSRITCYKIGMEKTITFKTPMTIRELHNLICEILPGADIQEDNNGQIMIYTGLREADAGKLENFLD